MTDGSKYDILHTQPSSFNKDFKFNFTQIKYDNIFQQVALNEIFQNL